LRQAVEAAGGLIPLSSLPQSQVRVGSPYVTVIDVHQVAGTISLGSPLPNITTAVEIQGGASPLTIKTQTVGSAVASLDYGASLTISTGLIFNSTGPVVVDNAATLSVSGITFKNGPDGAIVNHGGTINVVGCQFRTNFRPSGGSIFNEDGTV